MPKRKRHKTASGKLVAHKLGTLVEIVYRHHSGELRRHKFKRPPVLAYTDRLLIVSGVKVSEFIED